MSDENRDINEEDNLAFLPPDDVNISIFFLTLSATFATFPNSFDKIIDGGALTGRSWAYWSWTLHERSRKG